MTTFEELACARRSIRKYAPDPVQPEDLAALLRAAQGHVCSFWERQAAGERSLHVTARVHTAEGVRCRAVAQALPAFARPEEPTLEDAYLYLLSQEERP